MNTILMTLLLAFAIVLGVIAAMSIGVMNGRRPISGSCGGLNNGRCELCSGNCRKGKDQ
jgi:hypothetical protein